MKKTKKLLVTGGSGFIGTNLIQYLSADDFEILNLDLKEPSYSTASVEWKCVDLLDSARVRREVIEFRPEFVIHLAARCDLFGSTLGDYNVNTQGTKNLLNALATCKTVDRAIFVSTMLVRRVGNRPKGIDDYTPTTLYGESKMIMEKIIREEEHNYDWTINLGAWVW